ncbi:hypothetical protein [Hyunsoonleella pacifica]|uniref:Uncharacterized protein n=1 Tax=Hyunsoonleella pacifica TaxID=1080224 RepID=A0A4Q9FNR1_9FLAO|nr:hypothetical protein [Hyunsoonleella pacifica]TBN16436.1 hypothetical protein EYD46_07270 [Hyunsoonleella pacifica]GGD19431.1 hypothetical protein GCM10011368_21710 [Hyunsoonleella pacifica]
MKNLYLILLLILLNILLIISCKDSSREKFIEQFVVDLFDDNVMPEYVVSKYIEVLKDSMNTDIRTKAAKDFVEEIRKPIDANVRGNWLIPNNKIKLIKKPVIYSYKKYEHINNLKINKISSLKDRVYVLLDFDKEEILQYFLLNEDQTKIISFSLLIKDKNQATFFRPY